jgi:hypothetical protein
MVYRWISGNSIIAEVFDRYNIETSDWMIRAGYWINEGLYDIKALPSTEIKCKVETASDYLVDLPCSVGSLQYVEISGIPINESSNIRKKENSSGIMDSVVTYSVLKNGKIRIEADSTYYQDVEVKIYYKGFDTEFDEDLHQEIPFIPDNHEAREALALYLLIRILSRGYEHPVFSIKVNNSFTNPNVLYYGADGKSGMRKRAMLSLKRLSKGKRDLVSRRIRTFLHPDYHRYLNFSSRKYS